MWNKAVAIQFFNASNILLLAHEPSLGGIEQYIQRQCAIKCCVEEICGIAVTLKDDPSSMMSSQALYIGLSLSSNSWAVHANQDIAGKFTQDQRDRKAILELLESCRDRSGWPVRSLGEELQQFWEDHESTKSASAANLAMRSNIRWVSEEMVEICM